ncbi:MAG TPA: hypothetical protein VN420_01660 [Candidatus Fimivivens sp.]|nr:hypothetical protein [Candidatus Fimivivens sp.]
MNDKIIRFLGKLAVLNDKSMWLLIGSPIISLFWSYFLFGLILWPPNDLTRKFFDFLHQSAILFCGYTLLVIASSIALGCLVSIRLDPLKERLPEYWKRKAGDMLCYDPDIKNAIEPFLEQSIEMLKKRLIRVEAYVEMKRRFDDHRRSELYHSDCLKDAQDKRSRLEKELAEAASHINLK